MPFCPFAKNNAVRLERADWWGFLEARFSATLRVKITKSIDFLFSKEIKYKLRWIMLISKLGPEPRGKRIRRPRRWRRGGGSLSLVRSSVKCRLPRTVGREERQGGKARKRSKSLCSSFWKRTLVEPRETPDSLQRARHYSLTFPSLAI